MIGLLCSRSRSQQALQIAFKVCQDNSFWMDKPLETILGMMVHRHKPECHAKTIWLLWSRSQGLYNQNSYDYFWVFSSFWSFIYQTLFDGASSQARLSCDQIVLLCSQSRSQQRFTDFTECLSKWYLLNCLFLVAKPMMVKHHHEPECIAKGLICCHKICS